MKRLAWTLMVVLAVTLAMSPVSWAADKPQFHIDSSPTLRPSAREVCGMYRYGHNVAPGVPIPDGYLDGGRGMRVHSNGRATSGREIIVVDRAIDKRLRDSIAFAKSSAVMALKPQARALRIQRHIHWAMGRRRDRKTPLRSTSALAGRYRSRGVLVGDIGPICNDGVCRHQSLLFKIMGDAAGLKVALVRGNYRHSNGRIGGHAWNELHLDNGSIFLFDVLNSRHFYGLKHPKVAKYLSMAKRPLYVNGLVPRRAPYITTVEAAPAMGKATLKIVTPSMYGKVHFTLDGTNPTKGSPRYTKPIPLTKTTTVKAVAIYSNGDTSKTVTKTLKVLSWRSPVTVGRTTPGLKFAYYAAEGKFRAIPAFDTLRPEATGRVRSFDISRGKGKDNFAMRFTGYIRIPADGIYEFATNSDDGSKLWIGDECVVDNGGRHGPQRRSGRVALKAGLHPLRVDYFEYVGDETLHVTYRPPGTEQDKPLPANILVSP